MIKIVNLHKSFGKEKILKGVNLDIEKGNITVIIGGSGSGKTVFLRHIIGLVKPDDGQIIVDGLDITSLNQHEMNRIREKFGMVFQNAALFDSMTVEENVGFYLDEHTNMELAKIRERVGECLAQVGLEGTQKKFPSQLSGGMKKRVGIARALIMKPQIILYDEPTTGLDPITTDVIDNLIIQTTKNIGATAVVVSHGIAEMFKIADKIAMLYKGEIVAQGTPEEIRASDNLILQQFITGSAKGPISHVNHHD
ncbi:ABC transporter ATP-binding protein [bacterium]|nr:ABC transporter ATP-binding protein [bacterium]